MTPDQLAQLTRLANSNGNGGLISNMARSFLQKNNAFGNALPAIANGVGSVLQGQGPAVPPTGTGQPNPLQQVGQVVGQAGLPWRQTQPVGQAASACPTCGQPMMGQIARSVAPVAGATLQQMAMGPTSAQPSGQQSNAPNATSYSGQS